MSPVAGGFSRVKLGRLTAGLQGYVDRGEAPGFVVSIRRRGEVAYEAVIGSADDDGAPLGLDAIFRLGSMTKPIVCAAALALMEDGVLRLSDTIDRWLPELANPRVLRDPLGALDDATAATRPITVEDLMTQRAGFVTASVPQGEIGRAAQALQGDVVSMRPDVDADGWLALLAALPLIHQPGERMVNGFAMDVLGILIARASGGSLEAFLRTRLFEPLGMQDAGFWVESGRLGRLPPAYAVRWMSGRRVVSDHPADSYWSKAPSFQSGAGGLVATADDYARFGAMLLGERAAHGDRILSRKTVALMTTNFLTPEQRRVPFFGTDYWADRGLGLGVRLVLQTPRGADVPADAIFPLVDGAAHLGHEHLGEQKQHHAEDDQHPDHFARPPGRVELGQAA